MKTAKQFSIMMAIVLLSLSINSCHQQRLAVQFTDHTITLEVDTENITRQDLDATCRFLPKKVGLSNRDYTTEVAFNDTITWEGKSLNGTDIVEIKKIKYESGHKVLTADVNRNQRRNPKVHGIVMDSTEIAPGTDTITEKYLIKFKVNGKLFRYKIDPKIQVNRNR